MNISLKSYFQLLSKYLNPQIGRVILLAVLVFASIFLKLANPQVMRTFIDGVTNEKEINALIQLAAIYLVVALITQAAVVGANYLGKNVGWTATNALRVDLMKHCLDLDLGFHNAHTPGEMIERIDGDVNQISAFFSQFVIQVLGNILLMAGVLVLLFFEDWRVGLAVTFFTLTALYVVLRLRNVSVPHWNAERQASAEMYGFLEERLAGTEDIRANGGVAYTMNGFFRSMRNVLQRQLKAALMTTLVLNTLWFIFTLGTALSFAIGAYLFLGKSLSIGAVYLIYQYTNILEQPIHNISRQLEQFQKATASIQRVKELLGVHSKITPAEMTDADILAAADHTPLAVHFDGISFGYDDSIGKKNGNRHPAVTPETLTASDDVHADEQGKKEIVLYDITFDLAPGKVLGLLGRTGSGKTTLTRLLFRLYDVDKGCIQLCSGKNGKYTDIRKIPTDELRQQVGMITQNIQLFNATVRDNLTFFDPAIRDEDIERVLEEVGMGDWLRSLPNGLDSELESGGGGLSAGEAQLLAFTRIFLKDPRLVILDEASSRLDPVTEAQIERAVDKLVENRTAIVIAHRLGTVQRADKILILEDGRILEYGERTSLAADPQSRFFHLMQTGMEEVLV